MRLPFSREEFFALFAAYNGALWPAVIALWVASVLAVAWLLLSRRSHDRWISGLLVVHWAWSAVAYHVVFFTRINPAAWLFAAIFLLQAALIFRSGVITEQLSFLSTRTPWTPLGWLLVAYGLLYPAVNAVEHGSVLTIPTFGLPCPTTIFTAGLLLLAAPRSRTLAIVPIIWSAIGGSAAFLLGVSADYALPVAGAALAVFQLQKSRTSSANARSSRRGIYADTDPRNQSARLSGAETHRRCGRVAQPEPPPGRQPDLSAVEADRARRLPSESAHADV